MKVVHHSPHLLQASLMFGLSLADNLSWVILQNCGNAVRSDTPAAVETIFDEPDDLYPPTVADTPTPVPELPETTAVPESSGAAPEGVSSTPSDNITSSTLVVPIIAGGFISLPPAAVVQVDEPSTGEMLLLAIVMAVWVLIVFRLEN